jgi:hypothetical protein
MAAQTSVMRSQADVQAKLEEMRPHLAHSMRTRNLPSQAA